ncbi:PHP domain-containing protein [Actinacidiphila glaucinigra]|uniref:PHP domain-containing protein n=1 Tax=Actinacidiphila glaucinigra TaxID=235986 RepID=UPI002E38105A|nr:PHP domain-containing protein [Actinacidiphila glaucinigra]
MDPVAALDRIAFLLERDGAPTYRVRAFRGASAAVAAMPPEELRRRAERAGGLEEVKGLGPKTAAVVREALAGERPAYLTRLAEGAADAVPRPEGGAGLRMRAALRGDCHLHSDWSDGGSPIETMARTAMELGHEWAALTDHSPRLTVARGLTAERLRAQLGVVAEVGERLPPSFRLLTGIECDILADGALDQNAELLDRLDVVVASVHSKLRMDRDEMTRRMISAISNPLVDVLGHCTGRLVSGKLRPESEFDADLVFAACERFGVAVEINSRPDRLDPPRRLLRRAVEAGVLFSIDSDAHAPGQLDWQIHGCARAEECGVPPERVVNTWDVETLLRWTRTRRVPAAAAQG